MAENVLYYGDNLEILRRYIEDESVDLVHLDPPFKSDQDYNILFAERNDSHPVGRVCSAHHFLCAIFLFAETSRLMIGLQVSASYCHPAHTSSSR